MHPHDRRPTQLQRSQVKKKNENVMYAESFRELHFYQRATAWLQESAAFTLCVLQATPNYNYLDTTLCFLHAT